MRILLEALGIIAPDRRRREPVALPSWLRWGLPLVVVAAVFGGALLSRLLGLLLWSFVR